MKIKRRKSGQMRGAQVISLKAISLIPFQSHKWPLIEDGKHSNIQYSTNNAKRYNVLPQITNIANVSLLRLESNRSLPTTLDQWLWASQSTGTRLPNWMGSLNFPHLLSHPAPFSSLSMVSSPPDGAINKARECRNCLIERAAYHPALLYYLEALSLVSCTWIVATVW